MKKLVLAAALVALTAAQAFAGDSATRWNGFYMGGYAGYASGKMEATDIGDSGNIGWWGLGDTFSDRTNGFTGGMQAGFNIQHGSWVSGLEADVGFLKLKGTARPRTDSHLTTDASYAATFRGRLGYASGPALAYVTGGAMLADFGSGVVIDIMGGWTPSSKTGSQWGWTAGAGIEWALDAHWSVKGEYLYYSFGKETGTVPNCGLGGCRFDLQNSGRIFRLGLNYSFSPR